MSEALRITYIGGPTALLELAGFRLLTDPAFDPAGTRFESGSYVLVKTAGPRYSRKPFCRLMQCF